jgi:hypothetical protein
MPTYAFSSKEEGSGALFGGPKDMVDVVCGRGGGGGGGGVARVQGCTCNVFT